MNFLISVVHSNPFQVRIKFPRYINLKSAIPHTVNSLQRWLKRQRSTQVEMRLQIQISIQLKNTQKNELKYNFDKPK